MKNTPQLETKIQAMSQKYREIKACQIPIVKKMAIAELRKMAQQVQQLMRQNETPSNCKWRRQIEDVLQKCTLIEKEMGEDKALGEEKPPQLGSRQALSRQQLRHLEETQMSKMVLRSVIMREVRSSELRIKNEEIEDIYNRMLKNKQIMEEMEYMVKEQGHDLEKIDQYLESTYSNAVQANVQLSEAAELQQQSRRLKFRLAVTGFFAALGYKLLGLPGMLMGLLTGHRVTK